MSDNFNDGQKYINLDQYDVTHGLYKESTNGFIVAIKSTLEIIVFGRLMELDNKIITLTKKERVIAQEMGFIIADHTEKIYLDNI